MAVGTSRARRLRRRVWMSRSARLRSALMSLRQRDIMVCNAVMSPSVAVRFASLSVGVVMCRMARSVRAAVTKILCAVFRALTTYRSFRRFQSLCRRFVSRVNIILLT